MRAVFILLICCLVQLTVRGQSSGNLTSTLGIQAVMELSVASTSSNLVFNSPDQYAGEYTISNFNTIRIKSNQAWNLSLASTSSVFSASGTFASPNMPASICRVGITGATGTVALSTTAQQLSTGNRGSDAYSGNTFNLTLKLNPGYNYGAGIYSIGIIYTLSAR